MRRLHRLLILLAALSLVAAACDGEATETDESPAPEPAPADTETAADGDPQQELSDAVDATLEEGSASYTVTIGQDAAGTTGATDAATETESDTTTTDATESATEDATTSGSMSAGTQGQALEFDGEADFEAEVRRVWFQEGATATTGSTTTDDATETATEDETEDATEDETEAATEDETETATEDETEATTGGTAGTAGEGNEVIVEGSTAYVQLPEEQDGSEYGSFDLGELLDGEDSTAQARQLLPLVDPVAVMELVLGAEDVQGSGGSYTATVDPANVDDEILSSLVSEGEMLDVEVTVSDDLIEQVEFTFGSTDTADTGTATDEATATEEPTDDATATEEPTDDATATEEPTDDATAMEEPTDDATAMEEPTDDATAMEEPTPSDTTASAGAGTTVTVELTEFGTVEEIQVPEDATELDANSARHLLASGGVDIDSTGTTGTKTGTDAGTDTEATETESTEMQDTETEATETETETDTQMGTETETEDAGTRDDS